MIKWHCKTYNELSKDELYKIIRLRIEVFIIEQNAPYQDCDFKDKKAIHLFATDCKNIVAYCRILPSGITYKEPSIGRVIVASEKRGKGLGHHLMFLANQTMKTYFNTTECRISAQSYLIQFYETWGFNVVSDEYLEDGLPHQEMYRK